MKKWFAVFLCIGLLIALTPSVSPLSFDVQATGASEDDGALIIENAGFEETAESDTPGWALLSGVIMPSGELAITDTEAYSGNHSLSITPISTFTDTQTSVVYSSVILGIRDGYSYTAGAYFKGNLAPSISIRFYNMYSVEVTSAAVKVTGEATADWTRLEVTGTVPSGVLFARVMLEGYGEGTLYVDDVDIAEDPLADGQAKPVAYGTQVPDGSFEDAAAGKTGAWTLEQEGSGKWELGTSAENASMENYINGATTALRLTTHIPGPTGATVYFYSKPFAVAAGETYTYSMKLRTSKTDLAYAYTYIMYYNSTSTADRIAQTSAKQRANINFGTMTDTLTAPAGTVYARLCVGIPKHNWWTGDGYGDSRWVDIDDVVVTDSTGAVVFEDDCSAQINGTKATLQAADTTAENATDGAAAVKMGSGKLVSSNIPVLQGKEYTMSVDVKSEVENSTVLIMEYYNQNGAAIRSYTDVNTKAGETETLTITQTAPDNAVYVKAVLLVTAGTVYADDVTIYAVTDSVSNFSFEQVNAYAGSGNFPMQWRVTGGVDAWSVSSPKNDMPNRTMGLKVVGTEAGSVYSSMMRATAGEGYLARIQASSKNGGGLRLAFFDAQFDLLETGELTAFSGTEWARYAVGGTAPADAAYVAFELVAAAGDDFRVDAAEFSTAVINVSDDTQMFLDDYVLAETIGMDLTFHEGEKSEAVLDKSTGDPWEKNGSYLYGSVLFDEEEQLYKMWYTGLNVYDASKYDSFQLHTCYATSPDGVNWTRPNLGIVDYGGNTNNNIIGIQQLASVIKQSKEDEPDDSKRYVMIYQDYEVAIQYQGSKPSYSYAYSADGIHWGEGTTFTPGWDVITAGWDDDNKQFITLQKVNIHGRRDQHFMTGTPDEWSVPLDAAALADIQDTLETYRADTYGTSFYVKDGNYIALEWLLKAPGFADTNVTHMMDGTVDLRLGYSRDLTEDWQRPLAGAIVDHGDEGERDRCMYTAAYAIDVGDEIWLYTGGSDQDHGGKLVWDSVNQQWTTYIGGCSREIFITKWRADGFASLNAAAETGVMTTKPMVFDGGKLMLNANAEGGNIRVELLDAEGNPIEGFTAAECDAITTDSVKHVVTWNGEGDLSALEGTAVTMRVYAENSEIYSFRFTDTVSGGFTPITPVVETVLEYDAQEMASVSSTGYVRFGNDTTANGVFITRDDTNYNNNTATKGYAHIRRYTVQESGTLIIDTEYTKGIYNGSAASHDAYPMQYAIVDKNGKIVFPVNGELGTASYSNRVSIPASDPLRLEVTAGDTYDFIMIDKYGLGVPMFFQARIFMNEVTEATLINYRKNDFVDGCLLAGANMNQQGEDGWSYLYATSVQVVSRVIGDTNADNAIDICDVVYLKNLLTGELPANISRYDLYEDGVCDGEDVNVLRKFLLRAIEALRVTP